MLFSKNMSGQPLPAIRKVQKLCATTPKFSNPELFTRRPIVTSINGFKPIDYRAKVDVCNLARPTVYRKIPALCSIFVSGQSNPHWVRCFPNIPMRTISGVYQGIDVGHIAHARSMWVAARTAH